MLRQCQTNGEPPVDSYHLPSSEVGNEAGCKLILMGKDFPKGNLGQGLRCHSQRLRVSQAKRNILTKTNMDNTRANQLKIQVAPSGTY